MLKADFASVRGKFRFGLLAPENGSTLDPSKLVKALHAQCVRDGAATLKASVTGFVRSGARVREVKLDTGATLACDGVVLAAPLLASACNTIAGLGKDVGAVGDVVAKTAEEAK